jgi:stage III sporulation protein AC
MEARAERLQGRSEAFRSVVRDRIRLRLLHREKQRSFAAEAFGILFEGDAYGDGKAKGANAEKYQAVQDARFLGRRRDPDSRDLTVRRMPGYGSLCLKGFGGVFLNTDLLLKVAGIGILVTVAYQILHKSGRDEQAMLVSLTGLIIVLFMLVQEMGGLFDSVKSIFGL